jgi:CelD/BcsL family acetyltransferase involved in cellulose biosynthesis
MIGHLASARPSAPERGNDEADDLHPADPAGSGSPAGPMTRIVTTLPELRALRADWERLLPSSPAVSGFHSPGWIEACWEARSGTDRQLHLLVAERDGTVVGILPTQVGPRGELSFIGAGVSNYGGPIVVPDHAADASAEWLTAIAADPRIRSLQLAGLRAGDPFLRALRGWRHPRWGATRLVLTNISPEVDLSGWADRYRAHKSHRRVLQRAERRLEAFGALTFEETADPTRIRVDLPDLFRFYRRRWSGRWVSGAFSERNQAFQMRAADSGAELFSTLRLDGRIVAATLSLRAAGVSSGYVLGHDDRLGPYSPGTLIIMRVLSAAAERGDPVFDFSLGRSAYKLTWADSERSVYLAVAGAGSALLVARHRLWARARSVSWLRRAKVEGPRLLGDLLGQTRQAPDSPGIPTPAPADWTVYRLSGSAPAAALEQNVLGFWEMERRFSPRLLELGVERSYRGDRAYSISRLGTELGIAWLAGPARQAAIAAALPVGQPIGGCWYQPIATGGNRLADLVAALAQPGVLVACAGPLPDERFQVVGQVTAERSARASGGADGG